MKHVSRLLLQTLIAIVVPLRASSQAFIRLSQPSREQSNVSTARQFIAGRTCTGCQVTINGEKVYVYSTGTFAVKKELTEGRNSFTIVAEDDNGKTYTKNITWYYAPPPPARATSVFRIDFMEISPGGNLELSAGDTLRIKMKGYPGARATWFNNVPLRELPASQSGGVPGYYTGMYILQPSDSLLNGRIPVRLQNGSETAVLNSTYRYSMMPQGTPLTGRTIDNMTYLTSSANGDRLGPDKTGYLDKDVLLQVVGKQGDYYKVRLSSLQTAFIPEPLLDTEIPQEAPAVSIVSDAKVWGDEKADYVSVELSDKLPYTSTQIVSPGKIIVDVHGAYAEQGISTLLQGTREITGVQWQQPAHDVFRMAISLKHAPWGYQIYYEGNRITVKVKRVPENLSLRGLVIGVDAGHGGGNMGSVGLTGVYEKTLTLNLSLQLKAALEREGASVIMTRTSEKFVANEDRLSFFRNANPDLLLSIHLNSSGNPVDVSGTATYYKHPFCEQLNAAIHRRLLETGLNDFKNNGGFNFILNNPTEFPDALIETLFISNPGDEEQILDPQFQQELVSKIMLGLKDYLKGLADGR
ncbi:N-acetylmuramoyl-L-alanine amidase [Chitinophaga oryzae]|uniref:N-acetylmuramoyl-L-alanine amidase n=1 Tax=Chitinophaga oryzae TaxID=2725414 RepID=A0AAE6ZJ36_9BACT|nr:N-acetylmuramoyl-L-alanine amidase [Chitinophaga oryzae]QJB34161.1 N-acetylmuramoyl-L-alanine amidase [Chitinophaga oryzae]QJB40681.1 N-acetylmuramoyl-L-alanine amidase [Chitinophaga oryzae]